jgi:hypothetical protein
MSFEDRKSRQRDATSELLRVIKKMKHELGGWEATLEILRDKKLMSDIKKATKGKHITHKRFLKRHGIADGL